MKVSFPPPAPPPRSATIFFLIVLCTRIPSCINEPSGTTENKCSGFNLDVVAAAAGGVVTVLNWRKISSFCFLYEFQGGFLPGTVGILTGGGRGKGRKV